MRLSEMMVHRAEREVIVCGGAYNSPQLLMLSGLGRPAELEELQIEVVAELPEVGLNLHDHPNAGAVYGIDEEISLFGALNEENLALFEAEGRGPLTSNVAEAGGFMRTRDGLEAPDIQFHFAPARFQSEGLVPGDGHGFALGACVLKPKSRGFVALGSPDPTAKPLIVHNYLEHPDDVASMVAGVRTSLEICESGPLGELSTGMLIGPASQSDEDILDHVRARVQTLYHPVGTCRMGDDPGAVVDRQLRVRGVEGLRVVDASVMPTVPRGNTNAPVIALAERAADLIRGRTPLARSRRSCRDEPLRPPEPRRSAFDPRAPKTRGYARRVAGVGRRRDSGCALRCGGVLAASGGRDLGQGSRAATARSAHAWTGGRAR